MVGSLNNKIKKKQLKIAIIGLGYVGLPIAEAFSKQFHAIGYDIDTIRVSELKYTPKYSIKSGINKFVKWYTTYMKKKNDKTNCNC